MPGMYAVTSMPEVSRTRATLRSAEFGFFGVVVKTRVQTPRRWGEPLSAGVFDFSAWSPVPCGRAGRSWAQRSVKSSGDDGWQARARPGQRHRAAGAYPGGSVADHRSRPTQGTQRGRPVQADSVGRRHSPPGAVSAVLGRAQRRRLRLAARRRRSSTIGLEPTALDDLGAADIDATASDGCRRRPRSLGASSDAREPLGEVEIVLVDLATSRTAAARSRAPRS